MRRIIKLLSILLLFLFTFNCSSKVFEGKLPEILGIERVEIESGKAYEDIGGFGEGHAIEVYCLSAKTVNTFEQNPSKSIPRKENGVWITHHWTHPPIDSTCQEVQIMALNFMGGSNNLQSALKMAEMALEVKANYFAFHCKPDMENPQEVELYILDVKGRIFYGIEASI